MKDGGTDGLLAVAYERCTKPGSMLDRSSWTTEEEVALMAGRPAVKRRGKLGMCMPSDFPEDVQPPPQSVADVERSRYKSVWHEATKLELDGNNTDRYIRSRATATMAETCSCEVGVYVQDGQG